MFKKGSSNKKKAIACYICAKNAFEEKRYDICKILLEKALKYDKKNIKVLLLMGECLEKMGFREKALSYYRNVIVLTQWKTFDENYKRASSKIFYLTKPNFNPLD